MLSRRTIVGAGLALPAAGALAAAAGPALAGGEFGLIADDPGDQSAAMQRAIDAAIAARGRLALAPGSYRVRDLTAAGGLHFAGVPSATRLVRPGGGTILTLHNTEGATLSGLTFDGEAADGALDTPALVVARGASRLTLEGCLLRRNGGNGLDLTDCSGSVRHCVLSDLGNVGLHSLGGRGLEIVHNHVHDIGNNGIRVWQRERREDGSLVAFNRIERVGAVSGGDGPNGNGVNVFRAGSVTVTGNRISDCRFSAIRDNAGSNVQIIANSCARLDETAIYVEFAFEGAVVADNLIEEAGSGISVTNFNEGGRLAVVSGNVIRNVFGARANPNTDAVGIAVEADAAVTGNVVEGAPHTGLALGWGRFLRNIAATGNVIRDCGIGISVSVTEGAGEALVASNIISGARRAAILGMDHDRPATGDLAQAGAEPPPRIRVSGNLVS
jgi:uncharacterized secreted repeat protein (TIGR03808 family)